MSFAIFLRGRGQVCGLGMLLLGLFLKRFCYHRLLLLLSIVFWGTLTHAVELPLLGGGKAIDSTGTFISTNATFAGGASLDGVSYQSPLQATPSATVSIQARINVDPTDVGKQADLLYVAGFEENAPFNGGSDTVYVTVSESNDLYDLDLYNSASVWMAQLAEAPFKRNVTLQGEMVIDDSSGWELGENPEASYYFVGYRLRNSGKIVYSAKPVILQILYGEDLTTVQPTLNESESAPTLNQLPIADYYASPSSGTAPLTG